MFEIKVSDRQIRRLDKALDSTPKKLERELVIAVNRTSKAARKFSARLIGAKIAMTIKRLNEKIRVSRKAKKGSPSATLTIDESYRPGLVNFKPRQIKKGVSFRISKEGGRQMAKSAFMGPKPGAVSVKLRGQVFRRAGKKRYPLVRLKAVSPWAVFKKRTLIKPLRRQVKKRLKHEVKRRIRKATKGF